MIQYIFPALLLIAAALFKAAADIMRNTYSTSLFTRFDNPQFWDARKSFSNKRIFNFPVDGWHLANSAMIICFVAGGLLYEPVVPLKGVLRWLGDLTVYAIVYNLAFNLFYNRVLRLKQYR